MKGINGSPVSPPTTRFRQSHPTIPNILYFSPKSEEMKKLALHWKILIGMALGIAAGIALSAVLGGSVLRADLRLVSNPNDSTALTASIDIQGENAPYSLAWSDGRTTSTATGLSNGQHSLSISEVSKKIRSDKKYNIAWSNGTITEGSVPVGKNQHNIVLTDAQGNKVSKSFSVPEYASLTIKAESVPRSTAFVRNWIKPLGTVFINLLKMIAIPLIIVSLIKGVSDLQDISKLSAMGGRTLSFYIFTTMVAVSVGLLLVNIIAPGEYITEETRMALMAQFEGSVNEGLKSVEGLKEQPALQPLVDLVPDNFFKAASDNKMMLQVITFVLLFGVGLILIEPQKSKPVKDFFEGANEVVMKLVDIIMLMAPIGVFGLMAALVAESPSADIFQALALYAVTVLSGLVVLYFVDLLWVRLLGRMSPFAFVRAMAPAQLLAFSTSSSAATLPVTTECVEERLGVDREVASFVLPVGATVNMDGTSLYQAVAAVFIAQAFGIDLTLTEQLSIILTATLASIGSAPVPGAGMLMLVVILESVNVPPAGIALIMAIDRPLDMCRTVLNITGDAVAAVYVGRVMGKINKPAEHPDSV